MRSTAVNRASMSKALRPSPCIRLRRSSSIGRFQKAAISDKWSRGSASAPMPPGLALEDAGIRGEADILRHVDMLVAAGGGERDTAVDTAILTDSGARRIRTPPERTPDVGLAPHPVACPAVQSAGRQHFDRAWRHRLFPNLHGRGDGRR